MSTELTNKTLRIFLTATAYTLLVTALVIVLLPFMKAILWATVVVVTTWPIYLRVKNLVRSKTIASTLMTIGMAALFLSIVVPTLTAVFNETKGAVDSLKGTSSDLHSLLSEVKNIPWIGEKLFDQIQLIDVASVEQAAQSYGQNLVSILSSAAKGVAGAVFTWFFTLFTMFFLYRDGQTLITQFTTALSKIAGPQFERVLDALRGTIQGAVYGMLVTALAQGILAGIAYIIAGAPLPYLLGFLTMLLSFIPFGPPLVYIPVCIWIALKASLGWGIFMFAWGVAVVSLADNFLRPFFISQATALPLLLILMGVLGGIFSFGLIGLFIGPVIIAVAMVMWQEFVKLED